MKLIDAPCVQLQRRGGWAEDRALQRCRFPIGPANTWSNLAYPLAGAALLSRDQQPATWVMATALLVLGLGSGLYHGFKTLWANKLDHVGMYLVFGALVAHSAGPGHPGTPLLMGVTGILFAGLFSYTGIPMTLDVAMGVLLYLSSLPGLLHGRWSWLGIGYGLFMTSFAAWQLDKRGARLVGRWGHAIWHIGTAAAIAAIYRSQQG